MLKCITKLFVASLHSRKLHLLCVMHNDRENHRFDHIPLIKSVLQSKPDSLLINSARRRCSTFRNSTRGVIAGTTKLAHHTTWTRRQDDTLYLLRVNANQMTKHITLWAYRTKRRLYKVKCYVRKTYYKQS